MTRTITAATEWDTINDGAYGTAWEGYYDGATKLTIDGTDYVIPRCHFLLATDSQDRWHDKFCGAWKRAWDDGQCSDRIGGRLDDLAVQVLTDDDVTYRIEVEGSTCEASIAVAEGMTEEDAEELAGEIRDVLKGECDVEPEVVLVDSIDDLVAADWNHRAKSHRAGILRVESVSIETPGKDIDITAVEVLGGDKGYSIDGTDDVYASWADVIEAAAEMLEKCVKNADPLAD